ARLGDEELLTGQADDVSGEQDWNVSHLEQRRTHLRSLELKRQCDRLGDQLRERNSEAQKDEGKPPMKHLPQPKVENHNADKSDDERGAHREELGGQIRC